jgi:hypothetical protein
MATPHQRAYFVVCDAETKSFITEQRNYQQVYGGGASDTETIEVWSDKFLATRNNIFRVYGGMRRCVSEEEME